HIADGTVAFVDWAGNGCASGQTARFNGTNWVCGPDYVTSVYTAFVANTASTTLACAGAYQSLPGGPAKVSFTTTAASSDVEISFTGVGYTPIANTQRLFTTVVTHG